MKKMVKWFDSLKKHNVEIKLTEIPEETAEPVEEEVKEEPATAKSSEKIASASPRKKTTRKRKSE
jgi:hypothetical protein